VNWGRTTLPTEVSNLLTSCLTWFTKVSSAFNEKLKQSKFNPVQKAMLQQRLNLLNSFLRGDGGDISSFFKQGRLVIIDLSDPFVDGKSIYILLLPD
jgi:hypothetical protein